MKEGKKMKAFLNKLGSLLRSLVQDIYLETVCAPKDDLVTCGAGIISITGTIAAGYNPFVTTTEGWNSIGETTSSMDNNTATVLGITSAGNTTYGLSVATSTDPNPGKWGIYNADGKKIGSIREKSRTDISRVERNAEKVYSNFHNVSVRTSTPIIMAHDPMTYNAVNAFLKARSREWFYGCCWFWILYWQGKKIKHFFSDFTRQKEVSSWCGV